MSFADPVNRRNVIGRVHNNSSIGLTTEPLMMANLLTVLLDTEDVDAFCIMELTGETEADTKYRQGMVKELRGLWKKEMNNDEETSWNIKPIKARTLKRATGWEIEIHKARLDARGFTQRFGVNFIETRSPVISLCRAQRPHNFCHSKMAPS